MFLEERIDVLANHVLPCGSVHFKHVVSNMFEERDDREEWQDIELQDIELGNQYSES